MNKTKLEDWNEIWKYLEGQFCILFLKKKKKDNITYIIGQYNLLFKFN